MSNEYGIKGSQMKRMLTFDDVALQPRFNNVDNRAEPFLGTNLTKHIRMAIPIVASGMESVIGEELADILLKAGSKPIFHRFAPIEQVQEWLHKYQNHCVISWGVHELDKLIELVKTHPSPAGVCFDIAHGHSIKMQRAIGEFKSKYPTIDVIAGAVCTERGFYDLVQWGADGIRVGIGPGASCTTRTVTGFGAPQFSAIQECSEHARVFKVPLIADGGIRNSRDCVLALAAGADCVMMGKLFAACEESAAEKRHMDSQGMASDVSQNLYSNDCLVARYKGQASASYQREGRIPEGEEGWVPVTGPAAKLLAELEMSIKSGLTYAGARTIEELQKKAKFVEVTPTYHDEMSTRF
jgi:IMP dehydrogenase